MAREVSEFLASLRTNLVAAYPAVSWYLATPKTGLDDPASELLGTIAVDDGEEIDESAVDRMTGAWYVNLPLVISLYFGRWPTQFEDYQLPRDFVFSVAAYFRKRLVGIPSQAVSQVGTIIREVEIAQKVEDGVDSGTLANWLLWQIRTTVPLAIMPQFPVVLDLEGFAAPQGPAEEAEIRIDDFYYSENPDETDPGEATQIFP